jgi:hypothetical protein
MSDDIKPKQGEGDKNPDMSKFVPKDDYEAQKTNLEKLQSDFDRVKEQLLDPEYLEYLEAKKSKAIKKSDASSEVKSALDSLTADEIERLPKARLLDLAEKRASEKLSKELKEEFRKEITEMRTALQNIYYEKELENVKSKYKDFDEYQANIRKILERPGNSYTYEDAYLLAKAQAGKNTPPPPVDDKPKEKRSSGEKPSSSVPSDDFKQKDFKDKDDASNAALQSVRAKYGIEGDII